MLDVPKVTILDFGLYCTEKEAGRYANVSSAEFCRPCEVKSKYGCVKIDFSDAQIDADLDTVKVMVDNKECETCVIDNSLYAVLPFGVKNGDHKVFVSYKCYDTKGFYEELNVSSQDFAVWTEEKPVVWHADYSEEADFKYSFEILKDGYYSLYASAGEKDSDEYAKCVFDISGICSFAADDAAYESAGDGMGYYKFDSIYLKKGEYQLCISKAEGEELKEIALDYTGLIFDYEVVSRVEGEAYENITFPNSGTAVSGGKTYLYANSPIEQDGESYSITYSVSVPEDGEYTLCAVTAPTDNLYYSPYRFIIDGEVIVNSHYSREAGADVGSLKTYSYGDLYLTEGEHEIQVIVENRRLKGSPLSYYFWMDCIELRTKPDTDSAPYSYVTFNFENLYEDAVLPDVYRKISDKENRMQHLELIKQKEILPGESVSAKFTVKNTDGGLKNIYIWDRALKPLTNVIVYE